MNHVPGRAARGASEQIDTRPDLNCGTARIYRGFIPNRAGISSLWCHL